MSDPTPGLLPLKHAIVNPLYIPKTHNEFNLQCRSSSTKALVDAIQKDTLEKTAQARALYLELPKGERKRKNPLMAWRLEFPISQDKAPHGEFGGIPDLRAFFMLDKKNEGKSLETLAKKWPKDSEGKLMAYAGSVRAGLWPWVFHNLTKWKPNPWLTLSYYGIESTLSTFESDPTEVTYHLWTAFQTADPGHEDTDCFVHIESHRFEDEKTKEMFADLTAEREQELLPWEDYSAKFRALQAEAKVQNPEWLVNQPIGFLEAPSLHIDVEDGDYNLSSLRDLEPFSRNYGKPILTLFGEPRGQQTPHRWIAPNPLPAGPRGLVPLMHWHCPDEDMDMQVLADLCSYDRFHHYCKLHGTST